ncbi:hypothetical protein QWA_06570 [Alcaligenes faecalis subsp. faecalis NCIB 8687]|nr:hypothetical protein QWA_06570 [Alcaligenes faecalis subsp. faecalis NCIB 8687]
MRRVPAGLLKRLERVEQARSVTRPRAAFPPIMGADEWEAEAVASQERLVFLTREHLYVEPEPSQEQSAADRQAEHHAANREQAERYRTGPREYLEHEQERIRQATVIR